MTDFPLHLFLDALAAESDEDIVLTVRDYDRLWLAWQTGGDWTLARLKHVLIALLAKDEDQQRLIGRKFELFFGAQADIVVPEFEIRRVLDDLRTLPDEPRPGSAVRVEAQGTIVKRPPPAYEKPPARRPFPIRHVLAALLLTVGLGMGIALIVRQPPPVQVAPTPIPQATPTPLPQITPTTAQRLYPAVPYVHDVQFAPLSRATTWLRYAGLSLILSVSTLLYALYLRRVQQGPQDQPPAIDPDAPQMFHPGVIGGQPQVWLDQETLAELADSMGYFTSAQPGRKLNVAASIKATVQQGGIPTCEFYARRHIRTLLILEDAHADALAWNPTSRELAEGMRRYGVPVMYGQFRGSPEIFRTPDGHVAHLEDLEDQRRGILVLLFTDGKGFYRPPNAFALERLARWPMVAWLELRERRFWDELLRLPQKYKLPIYPATRDGVLQAVKRFLTERGTPPQPSPKSEEGATPPQPFPESGEGATPPQPFPESGEGATPPQPSPESEEGATSLPPPDLGGGWGVVSGSLPWAQACAMIQPISPGLADTLRRACFPDAPPEQIAALYALPNTTRTAAGLRFADDVLKDLRRGFLAQPEAMQHKVLDCIVRHIEAAKPDAPPDSLAYLSWEALRERVNMEINPDDDLQRFGELLQSPLGKALSDSLANFGFPDQPDAIPLRVKPARKQALHRLAQVRGHAFRLPAFVSRWHKLGLGLLMAVCVAALGGAVYTSLQAQAARPELALSFLSRLELRQAEDWQNIAPIRESRPERGVPLARTRWYRLPHNQRYRLWLYGNGYYNVTTFPVDISQQPKLTLATRDVARDCVETIPAIGLTVERCGGEPRNTRNTRKSWKERLGNNTPTNREMSIGLEIAQTDTPELKAWRQTVLATNAVDVMYRIQPDQKGAWQIEQAFAQLVTDLSPWMTYSQLLWWTAGQTPDITALKGWAEFQRTLRCGTGTDLAWVAAAQGVFATGAAELVQEAELLAALGAAAQVSGNGEPLVLSRTIASPSCWDQAVAGATCPEDIDGIKMEFVYVPGGCFQMGQTDAEKQQLIKEVGEKNYQNWYANELPRHEVCVDGFWMGKYEVTNAQYRQFKSEHDSRDYEQNSLNGNDQPAVYVSWDDAQEFVAWLNARVGARSPRPLQDGETPPGAGEATSPLPFRLPTEAEWEYAARAGETKSRYWGDNPDDACQYANVADQTAAQKFSWSGVHNCDDKYAVTAPVGSFLSNNFGLHDMLGNVWEWCADSWHDDYTDAPKDGSTWGTLDDGKAKLLRGGSWDDNPTYVRSAYRYSYAPDGRDYDLGVRLVRAR